MLCVSIDQLFLNVVRTAHLLGHPLADNVFDDRHGSIRNVRVTALNGVENGADQYVGKLHGQRCCPFISIKRRMSALSSGSADRTAVSGFDPSALDPPVDDEGWGIAGHGAIDSLLYGWVSIRRVTDRQGAPFHDVDVGFRAAVSLLRLVILPEPLTDAWWDMTEPKWLAGCSSLP